MNRTELWKVWTTKEILERPDDGGWFYGIVEDEGELCLAEIFRGYGWAHVSFGELGEKDREWALKDCGL